MLLLVEGEEMSVDWTRVTRYLYSRVPEPLIPPRSGRVCLKAARPAINGHENVGKHRRPLNSAVPCSDATEACTGYIYHILVLIRSS